MALSARIPNSLHVHLSTAYGKRAAQVQARVCTLNDWYDAHKHTTRRTKSRVPQSKDDYYLLLIYARPTVKQRAQAEKLQSEGEC